METPQAPALDFRKLLSQPMSDFREQPILSEGHWIGKILRYEFDRSSQRKTPFVRFLIEPTEETEDTEGESDGLDLTQYELRVEFYITPKALFMLTNFLVSLGFDPNSDFDESLQSTPNQPVLFEVEHQESTRPGPDGKKRKFANIVTITGLKQQEDDEAEAA